jgi:hypothetical protein
LRWGARAGGSSPVAGGPHDALTGDACGCGRGAPLGSLAQIPGNIQHLLALPVSHSSARLLCATNGEPGTRACMASMCSKEMWCQEHARQKQQVRGWHRSARLPVLVCQAARMLPRLPRSAARMARPSSARISPGIPRRPGHLSSISREIRTSKRYDVPVLHAQISIMHSGRIETDSLPCCFSRRVARLPSQWLLTEKAPEGPMRWLDPLQGSLGRESQQSMGARAHDCTECPGSSQWWQVCLGGRPMMRAALAASPSM